MRNLPSIKAKANAKYTCHECGSTELIQAHHKIPGDDRSLIVLCADCHSKRHPNLPKALFFTKNHQPYWYNISAASLAKDIGVNSRTIIRAARRLEISRGELIPRDEELIKKNTPKMQWNKPKPEKIHQRQLVREGRAPITEFTIITDAFLSVPEAANESSETESTICGQILANKLIAVTFGGILFVPKSEVERLREVKRE